MRLFFDHNLSPRLSEVLQDIYPDSVHVKDAGLDRADDIAVWEYARDHELVIVSKDSDFRQMVFLHGPPPKVVWIRRGNCSTSEIEAMLRVSFNDLIAFDRDEHGAFLALD